jgi:FkbM family methyltransferase
VATISDIQNCYRYILGREMNAEESEGARAIEQSISNLNLHDLRRQFLISPEFHSLHLETLFGNLVPRSVVVAHDTSLGFRIYLDLRQLHLSFGVLNGSYERREVELLRAIVPDDGVFFDVGGNVGFYSLAIASRRGFRGQVQAFEPLSPLFALFCRSIAENDLGSRITLRQVAVADAPGLTTLTDAESSINAGSCRLSPVKQAGLHSRVVEVETLDNLTGYLSPDVIKVDIEGAEGRFLKGGMLTLKRHRPTLLMEINSELLSLVSGISPLEMQTQLSDSGYRLWSVQPDALRPVSAREDLTQQMPASGVMNLLCVHHDRVAEVKNRVLSLY